MTRREALNAAAAALAPFSDTPRLDAELLMAHAFGLTREALLLGALEGQEPPDFASLLDRRMAYEPIAYITGYRDFWTIRLEVAPGVLIPRPDSETLIEAAVTHFGERAPQRILDLGTGSGALLLAALDHWPAATGLGIDASQEALAIAIRNGSNIAPGRAEFRKGDWASGVNGPFDLILCNPPYVEAGADLPMEVAGYEPASALFAGVDGLDDYRRIVPALSPLLSEAGLAAVEIGAAQADAVCEIFRGSGLDPHVRRDLAGRPRAVLHFALGFARQDG